jgi:prepilin-type N-terminal cleavage/methylation domain-containing protein
VLRVTRRRRAAFTLLEVIVALAVILILAAVSLPSLAGFLDQQRVEEAANQLAKVRDALYNPASPTTAFSQALGGTNAGRLSELDSVIIKGNSNYATGTDNSCGGTFTNGERNKWISNGPFMTYNSDRATGMMTPIGRAEDSLTRIPNSANPALLRLNFLNNVSLDDATGLDALVDGGNGYNAGTVQWTPQNGTNGIVTLYYLVTVNGTC